MELEQIKNALQTMDREDLLALRRSVNHHISLLETLHDGIDPAQVVSTAAELCGLETIQATRKEADVRARMIAALRLRRAGMRPPTIAPYIGRSRADAYHLLAQMELALTYPTMYPREVQAWKALLEIYPL